VVIEPWSDGSVVVSTKRWPSRAIAAVEDRPASSSCPSNSKNQYFSDARHPDCANLASSFWWGHRIFRPLYDEVRQSMSAAMKPKYAPTQLERAPLVTPE